MSLNDVLARQMGTPAAAEDLEKRAHYAYFAKVAAEANIDLNALTPERIGQLYENWNAEMAKAAEEETKEEKEKRLVEEAKRKHEEKKEASAQIEYARELGRQMFAGFAAEAEASKEAGAREHAEAAGSFLKDKASAVGGYIKGKAYGERGMKALEIAKDHAEAGSKEVADVARSTANKELGKRLGVAGGATAATAGGAVGAKKLYDHVKGKKDGEKEASAATGLEDMYDPFEVLAVKVAFESVTDNGWDAVQAEHRLVGLLSFGLAEGELSKQASAGTFPDAVNARALEYIVAAGYPLKDG